MKSSLPLAVKALTVLMAAAPAMVHATPASVGSEQIGQTIDSIESNADRYEGMARRSLLGGGSKPVSFAGEAITKFIGSTYSTNPTWMDADRTEFKNSFITIRTAMVAKPHRNLTLWSKIAFNHALLGYPTPNAAGPDFQDAATNIVYPGMDLPKRDVGQWDWAASTGDIADKRPALLYEDMALGLVGRVGPVTMSVKAGGVLWNELSPLTVWKTQPRMFGWDFLPFELEQSTAMFYDYATVKGFKEGRAAWNKKPFQGLQLETVEMPWNLYFNALYGYYEGYLKTSPWLVPIDKTTELQYTGSSPGRTYGTKASGISDSYRNVYFLRFAKAEIPGGVTAGINWFAYDVDEDYPLQWSTNPAYVSYGLTAEDAWQVNKSIAWTQRGGAYNVTNDFIDTLTSSRYVNNFYLEPRIGSIDFRRNIPGGLNFHVDFAMSRLDSVWFKLPPSFMTAFGAGAEATRQKRRFTYALASELDSINTTYGWATARDSANFFNEMSRYPEDLRDEAATTKPYHVLGRTSEGWKPAVYATVSYPFQSVDLELRTVYAAKGFHSPASTVAPIDGIFPYEANLVGPGKFAGVDNGTSYASNLAGANLIAKLPVPRGHARISYGLHGQPEKGSDMVWFPWRQNGAAFNATLNSNFTRYGVGLLDDYLRSTSGGAKTAGNLRSIRRIGNESFFRGDVRNQYAPAVGSSGGPRGDYMTIYEGFAAYKLDKSTFDSNGVRLFSAADSAVFRQISANQDSSFGALPQSRKYTQNISLDASYEISRLWGGKQSVFVSGYAAFNSITKGAGTGLPAFATGKDVLLMSRMLRFEPVVQITPRFYVIGLIGNEVWKSDYGVAAIETDTSDVLGYGYAPGDDSKFNAMDPEAKGSFNNRLVSAPVDFNDWIYGLGFDWDIAPRVGFHVRAQYFTHEDKGISENVPGAKGKNDYDAWLGTAEMKMWF